MTTESRAPNGCSARSLSRVFIVAFTAALVPVAAAAQDGSWYLRLGGGFDHPGPAEFTDLACTDTSFNYIYGCGPGNDGARTRSFGGFGNPGVMELGLGRGFGESLRLEAFVAYRPRVLFRGNANYRGVSKQTTSARITTLSGMLAAYADLPLPSGTGIGRMQPFVGLGFGMVQHRMREKRIAFTNTSTIVQGGAWTDAAWMMELGSAVRLNEDATLDISWRYTDLGEAGTKLGDANVIKNSDGTPFYPPGDSNLERLKNIKPTSARYSGLGMRLSLRFAF